MMTEPEKYLEERLPDIETLKQSITELNNLDLNEISIKELEEKINDFFPIINFGKVIWNSEYHLFRVRKNHKNIYRKPYNNLCQISIPPANLTPFGRANNEYEPVFYGSSNGDLALFESCQKLSKSEKFTPQNFTMGIWKVKENEELRLIPVVESKIAKKNRIDIQKVIEKSEKSINELKSEKVIQTSKMISSFFAEQFVKSDIKNLNQYKISSYFSNYIKNINKISPVKFDGILYPSVANKFRDDNVALFPESFNKLEIVKCFSVSAYNVNFEKGSLTKAIFAEGTVKENQEIIWKEKH